MLHVSALLYIVDIICMLHVWGVVTGSPPFLYGFVFEGHADLPSLTKPGFWKSTLSSRRSVTAKWLTGAPSLTKLCSTMWSQVNISESKWMKRLHNARWFVMVYDGLWFLMAYDGLRSSEICTILYPVLSWPRFWKHQLMQACEIMWRTCLWYVFHCIPVFLLGLPFCHGDWIVVQFGVLFHSSHHFPKKSWKMMMWKSTFEVRKHP
jgi:hypothetical protein